MLDCIALVLKLILTLRLIAEESMKPQHYSLGGAHSLDMHPTLGRGNNETPSHRHFTEETIVLSTTFGVRLFVLRPLLCAYLHNPY